MRELQEIIRIFQQTQQAGQRAAIATVVKTSGSVYRRPGARLFLTEAGQMVGAISGGCLESDVFERAQALMVQGGGPTVVQYDTTASDDIVWGLGLGCNGVVQVLIEPLDQKSASSPLKFLAECFQQPQSGAIATVFQATGNLNTPIASRLLLRADGTVVNGITDPQLAAPLLQDIYRVFAAGQNQVKTYTWEHGSAEVLIEVIHPPISLLLFGAGADAIPVTQLAQQLGWHVTVIDHRPAYATRDRFLQADALLVCHPNELPAKLDLHAHMVAVVMTHNYSQDQSLLRALLPSPIRYLGLLGPKRRTQQLLEDLRAEGFTPTESQLQRLYAPVGLDIGGETPDEIALAIVAEIQAVLANRAGCHLRHRSGSIHGEVEPCPALVW